VVPQPSVNTRYILPVPREFLGLRAFVCRGGPVLGLRNVKIWLYAGGRVPAIVGSWGRFPFLGLLDVETSLKSTGVSRRAEHGELTINPFKSVWFRFSKGYHRHHLFLVYPF
jgi:hypothetical protein